MFGPGGTLWVTDTIRHSISVFDPRGGYLGRIGGLGRDPGQYDYPIACAFLARDRIVVLERAGGRCQILDFDLHLDLDLDLEHDRETIPASPSGLAAGGP